MIEQDPRVTEGPSFFRSMYDWMRRVAVDLNQKTTLAAVASAMPSIAAAAGFAVSFGTHGYLKLPSWLGGLMVAWGAFDGTTNASSAVAVSFATSFPNGCFTAICLNGFINAGQEIVALPGPPSASVITFSIYTAASGGGFVGVGAGITRRINYIALGN